MSRTFALFLVLYASAFVDGRASAEDPAVDLIKFGQELQRVEADGGKFQMIWWIPTEYWNESFKNAPMTAEQKDAFKQALDDYLIVAVIDGKILPVTGLKAQSEDHILKNIAIQIGEDEPLTPLSQDEMSDEAQTILVIMKPVFGKMLGDFGKGMELVCFQGKDAAGKRLINPRENGHLRVTYSGKDYNWRLPLSSMLPPKYDAKSGEKFPGNYKFNPFTGEQLTTNAPAASPPENKTQD